MNSVRFILVPILTINLSLVAPCFGQRDVDSLKAANRILAESVTLANVDLFIQQIHPQALGFFKASQFPVQFTPQNDVRDMAPTLLAELSTFITMTLQDAYRVIGDTGVVCSTFSRTPAPLQTRFVLRIRMRVSRNCF